MTACEGGTLTISCGRMSVDACGDSVAACVSSGEGVMASDETSKSNASGFAGVDSPSIGVVCVVDEQVTKQACDWSSSLAGERTHLASIADQSSPSRPRS